MINCLELKKLLIEYRFRGLFKQKLFIEKIPPKKVARFKIVNGISLDDDNLVGFCWNKQFYLIFMTDRIYIGSMHERVTIYYEHITKVKLENKKIILFLDDNLKRYVNYQYRDRILLNQLFKKKLVNEFFAKLTKINNEPKNTIKINYCTPEDILKNIPWANEKLAKEICDLRDSKKGCLSYADFDNEVNSKAIKQLGKYFDYEVIPKTAEKVVTQEKTIIKSDEKAVIDKLPNIGWLKFLMELIYIDYYKDLKDLKDLLDLGIITNEEFFYKKRKILNMPIEEKE